MPRSPRESQRVHVLTLLESGKGSMAQAAGALANTDRQVRRLRARLKVAQLLADWLPRLSRLFPDPRCRAHPHFGYSRSTEVHGVEDGARGHEGGLGVLGGPGMARLVSGSLEAPILGADPGTGRSGLIGRIWTGSSAPAAGAQPPGGAPIAHRAGRRPACPPPPPRPLTPPHGILLPAVFPPSGLPEVPKEVRAVKESRYRESRLCRVLGNPIVYAMVRLLEDQGPLSPSAVAQSVGRRLQTVSGHLATLRAVDLVRYDRRGGHTRYWIKHGPATKRILTALAAFVKEAGPPRD